MAHGQPDQNNMTPEQLAEFTEMKRQLAALHAVQDVSFIKNLERRLNFFSGSPKLSDLSDVSQTDGATTGTVLKKTDTTWQPGTDATS